MGNEEYPPDAGAGTTLDGAVATGARATAVAGADTGPSAGSGPGPLTRVRSALAGIRSRRALGWVLLVAWAAWLVAVWVTQPRLVPQDVPR